MKITQIILFGLLALGVVLRILDVPFTDRFLITLSGFALTAFYFVFGFMVFNDLSWKQLMDKETRGSISGKRYFYGAVLGLLTGCVAFGISGKFTFNFYAASLLEQTPVLLLFIAVFPVYKYFKTKSEFAKLTIKRIVTICVVSFIVHLIPNDILVDLYYSDPGLNQAYKEWLADPENPELADRIYELKEKK